MSDRTLTAAEHPRALSPLVEAVRLENAIKRKRRQVEKLATKLQDAEFERQVFERELARTQAQQKAHEHEESPVGVAATAEDGHEAPAQNRQPVEQPSDPATGTTRREPPETTRTGGSTGAAACTRVWGMVLPSETRRAVRCEHGFMPGLCEASGCAHNRRANGSV